jgi:hypothetical protein
LRSSCAAGVRGSRLAEPSPRTGKWISDVRDEGPQSASGRSSFPAETANGPLHPPQTAENRGCSAETGNSGLAQDCVVVPTGSHETNGLKRLGQGLGKTSPTEAQDVSERGAQTMQGRGVCGVQIAATWLSQTGQAPVSTSVAREAKRVRVRL